MTALSKKVTFHLKSGQSIGHLVESALPISDLKLEIGSLISRAAASNGGILEFDTQDLLASSIKVDEIAAFTVETNSLS